MAGEQDIEELPRDLQIGLEKALNTFIHDARGTDPNRANGVVDRLRRSRGLETHETRNKLTSSVERGARQVSDLAAQITMHEEYSTQAEQLSARLDKARTEMMTDRSTLGNWQHTKPDLMRRGLDSINKFVTKNQACLPELLELLKPLEAELRSDISKAVEANKKSLDVLVQLADLKQRCDAYDERIRNNQGTDGGTAQLLEQTQNDLRDAMQKLEQKTRDCEVLSGEAEKAAVTLRNVKKDLTDTKSQYETYKSMTQKNADHFKALKEECNDLKQQNGLAVRGQEDANRERSRLAGILAEREKELDNLNRSNERVVHNARGILSSISRQRSTVDGSLSLPQLVGDAYSAVVAHMRNCSSLEQEKTRLEQRLTKVEAEVQEKDDLVKSLSALAVESDGGRKQIASLKETIAQKTELLSKLPSLEEYDLQIRKIQRMEGEARIASHADETLKFCSSVLGIVSTCGTDPHTRQVDIKRLQTGWDIALVWSRQNRSSLTRRDFRPVVHGLLKPATDSNDALRLAQLLLVRSCMSPNLLSVALVEQLDIALLAAEATVVTRSMGFIYALLQEKIQAPKGPEPWPFSRCLLVVRCLSILALYVYEADVCSTLLRLARDIRDEVSCSSLLLRVMLEHAIKLLTGAPELFSETLAQSTIVRQVVTKTHHKLYPDGQDLIVVNVDNEIALVRPHQYGFLDAGYFEPCLLFDNAPLIGTCQIELPSLSEERDLYEIFHEALQKVTQPGSVGTYLPDYVFMVQ